jgi:glutathione S-transferase
LLRSGLTRAAAAGSIVGMTGLILHHYDFSNYSEKVRIAMGYKSLDWASVEMPPVLPKPDLVALTGGYRRAPVLQVGADIYCDTRLILRQLEARAPQPTLYPSEWMATANAISAWAETQLFGPLMLYAWGTNHDLMPPELFEDRARMRGLPTPGVAAVGKAAARSAPLVRLHLSMIEAMLRDRRRWICGERFSVADLAVYHAVWFLTDRSARLAHELTPLTALCGWRNRVRELGHGRPEAMPATEAIGIARSSEPATPRASKPQPEDPPPGSVVEIRAADYARDAITGSLDFIDDDEISIRIDNDRVGNVAVHFPRVGFEMRPAR